ncbi:type II secretion system F family protein [Corynebacterium sp. P5848]|uniref:type II secretion system F family protein n=1 Tax=Corynebacterium marambiense TaxID=2765364 RepID=UPI0022609441|nr:type II secretion system F family protein [Corynebacterium marambiense]MCX7541738.1 type II secretion system F family protein [Corynebacterium marambiense]
MMPPMIWAAVTLLLLAAAALCSGPDPVQRLHPGTGHGPKQPRDRPVDASPLDIAADIELFAACTTAGLSTRIAIAAVAEAAGSTTADDWRRAGALLAVGAPVTDVWQVLAQLRGLDELARAARHSGDSGAGIATGCERMAARLRAEATDQAVGAAERAGVLIALPLTLCFLPAFILLGLAPMVLSLGTPLLG